MTVQANGANKHRTNVKGKERKEKKKRAEGSGTSRHVSVVSVVSFDLMTYSTAIFPIERENPATITTPAIRPGCSRKMEGPVLSTWIPWPWTQSQPQSPQVMDDEWIVELSNALRAKPDYTSLGVG